MRAPAGPGTARAPGPPGLYATIPTQPQSLSSTGLANDEPTRDYAAEEARELELAKATNQPTNIERHAKQDRADVMELKRTSAAKCSNWESTPRRDELLARAAPRPLCCARRTLTLSMNLMRRPLE